MNSAVDKLVKVLNLEADRGYDNRAVLGGLEKMIEPWREEARSQGLPSGLLDTVESLLHEYGSMPPAARREAVEGVRSKLEGASRGGGPAATAAVAPAAGPEPDAQSEQAAADLDAEVDEGSSGGGVSTTDVAAGKPQALGAPLTTVPGIGPKSASTLAKLGLRTLEDLLWYLPRRYDDYSQLKTIHRLWYGEDVTVIGTVELIDVRPIRGGQMKLIECVVSDGTGALRVTWFNQPWLVNQLRPGTAVALSGRVDQYLGRLTMNSPEWEPLERQQLHTNRIVPIYGLTAGVTARWLRRVVGLGRRAAGAGVCPTLSRRRCGPSSSCCRWARPFSRSTSRTVGTVCCRHKPAWPSTRCSCCSLPSCVRSRIGRR